jgi:hypothetical protein
MALRSTKPCLVCERPNKNVSQQALQSLSIADKLWMTEYIFALSNLALMEMVVLQALSELLNRKHLGR